MTLQIKEIDQERVKEISEDILKSMLARSYPAVDATHFFKKYSDGDGPDHQFMHALAMMTQGGILRIDTVKKPFSVTFVLMENNKAKMHHMIDDEWQSPTFGQMFNDPYEGPQKRVHCWSHIMTKEADCEKCKNETNSMICMNHSQVLNKCEKCQQLTNDIKKGLTEKEAPEIITAILKEYKAKYWSFEN